MHADIKAIIEYDSELRLFESQYVTPEGISYNSYIIFDEASAIMDTVDARLAQPWREVIEEAFADGKAPEYLIVQHLEPDHSSQIEWVMKRFPQCRIVCTAKAKSMMPLVADISAFESRIVSVADGETLSLGKHQLQFVTAPMVHWPEVMMTYDATSHTLFSADGFGRFGAPDASLPWAHEARRYYFNIVGKYGLPVQTVLKKLAGKQIDAIAPLHGPVLEGDLSEYLRLYTTWACYEVETQGVFVAYASIHGMTAVAAEKLGEILRENGAPKVKVVDVARSDMAEAVEEAFRMSHLVVMSPTYDSEIFPAMYDFIHHLAIKSFRNRRVGIVENGLWAPMAGKKMREKFEKMQGVVIAEPMVTLRGRLVEKDVEHLTQMAKSLLEK